MSAISNNGFSIIHFKNGDIDINVDYALLSAITSVAVATIIGISLSCRAFWHSRSPAPQITIQNYKPDKLPENTLERVQKFCRDNAVIAGFIGGTLSVLYYGKLIIGL